MPKLACKCGHVFDQITIPAPEGYSIVADSWLDRFGPEVTVVDLVAAIDDQTPEMYKCPQCKRLAVFWKRGELNPIFYRMEEPNPEG